MFDISFTEIMVIAVVALVVVGPERLPKVARTLGHLLGRVRRYVSNVKNDIQREMEVEELNELHTSVQKVANSFENSVLDEVSERKVAGDHNTATTPASALQAEIERKETPLKESSSSLSSRRSAK